MSDLLSRDTIEAAIADPEAYEADLVALARLYVSGRLVDREAIDYEAAWDAANQPHGFDTESRVSIGRRRLHAAIDAAIGDTDDNGCLLCGEDIVHSGPHYFGETIE